MNAVKLAQAGENTSCVECGSRPYGGGMRCLTCFQKKVKRRQLELQGLEEESTHQCVRHQPAVVCYIKCKCRCSECRTVMRDYRNDRKSMA